MANLIWIDLERNFQETGLFKICFIIFLSEKGIAIIFIIKYESHSLKKWPFASWVVPVLSP